MFHSGQARHQSTLSWTTQGRNLIRLLIIHLYKATGGKQAGGDEAS